MKETKAQAWGFDLIIASMIFLAGIIFFYFYTINYPSQTEESIQILQQEAELVSDSVLSDGSPENWNAQNVVQIGILTGGKINQTKLENFYNLTQADYSRTKTLFRIRNNYYLKFQNPVIIDGNEVTQIGIVPLQSENLIRTTRVAIYNNNLTTIQFNLWN